MSEITVASTTDTQESVNQAAGLENGRHDDQAEASRNGGPAARRGEPAAHVATATGEEESQESRPQALGHPRQAGAGRPQEDESEAEDTSSESAVRHGEPAAESETAEEGEEEQGHRPQAIGHREEKNQDRPKSRAEKRIKNLTRRVYEQQEELDALRERVVGRQPASPERDPASSGAEDGRPVPTSFRSYEQYIEALADWKAGQRVQQQKQAELVQAEQERTREVFDTYNEAAKSARVKYEDFEEVVGRRDLKIPQSAQVAIIEAGGAGPDIAYYLGKHPEVCHELAQMSPMRAVARIGAIEAELQSQASGHRPQATGRRSAPGGADPGPHGAPGSSAVPHNAPVANRRATTSAPAPITPVGGSSSRTTVPLGELPYRDYKRLRDQEERRRIG